MDSSLRPIEQHLNPGIFLAMWTFKGSNSIPSFQLWC
jgi:hypothetical protein